jgi:hypothetical protein
VLVVEVAVVVGGVSSLVLSWDAEACLGRRDLCGCRPTDFSGQWWSLTPAVEHTVTILGEPYPSWLHPRWTSSWFHDQSPCAGSANLWPADFHPPSNPRLLMIWQVWLLEATVAFWVVCHRLQPTTEEHEHRHKVTVASSSHTCHIINSRGLLGGWKSAGQRFAEPAQGDWSWNQEEVQRGCSHDG